jgi:hypothetical protein
MVTAGTKIRSANQSGVPFEKRAVLKTEEVQISKIGIVKPKRQWQQCFFVEKAITPEYMTWAGDDSPNRSGYLYNIQSPVFVVLSHAGIALGTAKRGLTEITNFSQTRSIKLPGQSSISSNPMFQADIAQLDLKLRAMNALSSEKFGEVWQCTQKGEN